jgi:hypothetical protein
LQEKNILRRTAAFLRFSTVFSDGKLWCFDGEKVANGTMFLAAEAIPLF